MSKHTPGPWSTHAVRDGDMIVMDRAGSETIARVYVDRVEQQADAVLISAAPDLLQACELAYASITARELRAGYAKVLRAAIKKARGT